MLRFVCFITSVLCVDKVLLCAVKFLVLPILLGAMLGELHALLTARSAVSRTAPNAIICTVLLNELHIFVFIYIAYPVVYICPTHYTK